MHTCLHVSVYVSNTGLITRYSFIHSFIVHEIDRVYNHDVEDKNIIYTRLCGTRTFLEGIQLVMNKLSHVAICTLQIYICITLHLHYI